MSQFGWPVPAEVRSASSDALDRLIEVASSKGYSRTAKGLEGFGVEDAGVKYVIAPIQPETSPMSSWICLVVAFRFGDNGMGCRAVPERTARLDIAIDDFSRLPRLSKTEKNELIHGLLWVASLGGGSRPSQEAP